MALLASGPALAAPPEEGGHLVSPVIIYPPTPAPKLVKSYPAEGQTVPAGVLIVAMTFDQQMLELAFDFGPAPGGEQPHCLKAPRLLQDNKTFVLLCTVEPSKTYALSLNPGKGAGFANVGEHRAEPASLAFSTSNIVGPRDIAAALKAADLPANGMPVHEPPDSPGRRDEP